MTRSERERDIAIICKKCGCSQNQKDRHYELFVDHQYQPHASLRFKNWWYSQKEFKDSQETSGGKGIDAITAQNVDRIWKAYLEAKQMGVSEAPRVSERRTEYSET